MFKINNKNRDLTYYLHFTNSIYANAKYIFFSNILEKAIFFLLFVILARKVQTKDYGIIVTIFAFSNILNSFFEFGFPVYFQRESASNSPTLEKELGTALLFRVSFIFLYLAISFVYLYYLGHVSLPLIFIVGLTIYLLNINVFLNSVLFGKKLYKESFQGLFFSRIISFFLLSLYFFSALSKEFAIVSLTVAAVIHFIFIRNVFTSNNLGLNLHFDLQILLKIFRSSVPISLGLIFVWIYDRSDVLITQQMLGFRAVAIYSVAYSIYKLPQIISGVIFVPVFTNLSNQFAVNKTLEKDKIIKILLEILIAVLFFSVVLVGFSDNLVVLLYGPKYHESADYIIYLVLALPGLILNHFTGIISNTIRKEKYPLYATSLGAAANIVLCFILIKNYGITGAVIATVVTEYIVLIIESVLLLNFNCKNKLFV